MRIAATPAEKTDATTECLHILSQLLENPDNEVFEEPVDFSEPGLESYPLLIRAPMDFGTIRSRLESQHYGTVAAEIVTCFQSDVVLTFENCMAFNTPNSTLWVVASQALQKFETAVGRLVTTVSKSAVERARKESRQHTNVCTAALDTLTDSWPQMSEVVVLDPPKSVADHARRSFDFPTVRKRLDTGFYGGPRNTVEAFAADVIELLSQYKSHARGKTLRQAEHAEKLFRDTLSKQVSNSQIFDADRSAKLIRSLTKASATISMASAKASCRKLLKVLRAHASAGVFEDPVPPEYTDYHALIRQPMSLSQVAEKLKRGFACKDPVSLVSSFASSMRLIWNNCCEYNAHASDIYRDAIRVRDAFEYHFRATFSGCGLPEAVFYHHDTLPKVVPTLGVKARRFHEHVSQLVDSLASNPQFALISNTNLSPDYLRKIADPLDVQTIRHRLQWYVAVCD